MQVIINEVISRVRAERTDDKSTSDTRTTLAAALEGFREMLEHQRRVDEEHSLENVHERAERRRYG
jgi:hypothetical protein